MVLKCKLGDRMKILIDADALPRSLKDALIKAAERTRCRCVFVAARMPSLPFSEWVEGVAAGNAFNGADDWIAEHIEAGDLVVTADIPLADRALDRRAEVLSPKGDFFTPANIKNALAMRELLEELRTAGEITGGPAPFSRRQRELFINALDRFLQKAIRKADGKR